MSKLDPIVVSYKKMFGMSKGRKLQDKECPYEETSFILLNVDTNKLNYFLLKITNQEYKAEHIISKQNPDLVLLKIEKIFADYFRDLSLV